LRLQNPRPKQGRGFAASKGGTVPGIRADATCRRLPDAWADDCPRCGHLRRYLSIAIRIRGQLITETITEWCDNCDPEETPCSTSATS
jgi:hypothetical protein